MPHRETVFSRVSLGFHGGSSNAVNSLDTGPYLSVGTGNDIVLATEAGETVFNENSKDIDFRIESDGAAQAFVVDAGDNLIRIGTGTAGAIADFSSTSVTINDGSADIDFRVESNGDANNLFSDGGADRVGVGTGTPLNKFHVAGASSL